MRFISHASMSKCTKPHPMLAHCKDDNTKTSLNKYNKSTNKKINQNQDFKIRGRMNKNLIEEEVKKVLTGFGVIDRLAERKTPQS